MRLVATAAILIATLSFCVPAESMGDILFYDDFEGPPDDAWFSASGGWIWEDGHLINTSSCGFQSCIPDIWAGGAEQYDYLISFDICLVSTTHPDGMSLYVRAMMSDPCEPEECAGTTSGYSCDVGYHDGGPETALGNIHRLDDSIMSLLASDSNEPLFYWGPGVVYRVKFGRLGDEIVFKKWPIGDPEPDWLLSATDTTYHAGYWSISYWHGIAWIDNFMVEGSGTVPNEQMSWGAIKSLYN